MSLGNIDYFDCLWSGNSRIIIGTYFMLLIFQIAIPLAKIISISFFISFLFFLMHVVVVVPQLLYVL